MTAVCMAVFYWNFTSICGISGYLFDCDVHGVPFKCIIPNHWKVPSERRHGSSHNYFMTHFKLIQCTRSGSNVCRFPDST